MKNFSGGDLQPSPEQMEVITSDADAVVVVASAGSGKTEVVARRLERILEDPARPPGRVLAVTYTVKAAAELNDRVRSRLGAASRDVDTETVHGFAHSVLRQHGTNIGLPPEPELLIRDEDRVELLNRWLSDNGIDLPQDPIATLRGLDLARATGRRRRYLDEWEQALDSAGALDYPGLLVATKRLLAVRSVKRQVTRTYSQVIVDEAQNLTLSQYELLSELISGTNGRVAIPTMLVGDEKQSIVSFAGADPTLMAKFVTDFNAQRYELTENFRSSTVIARVSESVASALGYASPSGDFAARGEVSIREAPDEEQEASLVAEWVQRLLTQGFDEKILAVEEPTEVKPAEIAILGRSAASLRSIRKALENRGIEYASASTSAAWLPSTLGAIAMEILSLRTATDHQSTHWQLARLLGVSEDRVTSLESLGAVLNAHQDPMVAALAPLTQVESVETFIRLLLELEPPVDAESEALAAWEADRNLLSSAWSQFDATMDRAALTWGNFKLFCARQGRGDDLAAGVRVLTIHKSQGREFRAVALLGLNDGQFPDFRATTDDELATELRTFYVAVSRARRSLLLTRPTTRMTRYGSRGSKPSRFLALVTEALRKDL